MKISKKTIKILARSGSKKFLDDFSPDRLGSPIQRHIWNGIPVHYRPGSSDLEIIYDILLKGGKKGEYWIPQEVAPKTILDIGANIGITSVYLAHRFPNAKIYSFEPVKQNYELVLKNTETLPNVTAFNVALGATDITLEMHASNNPLNQGGYSFHYSGEEDVPKTGVEVRNAKTFLAEQGIDNIDLIKIDTEGHEFEILTAMDSGLLSKTDWIIGELHREKSFETLAYLSEHFDIQMKKSFKKPLFMFNACNRKLIEQATWL